MGSMQAEIRTTANIQADTQEAMGTLHSDIRAAMGAIQADTLSVFEATKAETAETLIDVVNRLERLEATSSQRTVAEWITNPDLSEIAARPGAAPSHKAIVLDELSEDPGNPGTVRRSDRLLRKPRIDYSDHPGRLRGPKNVFLDLNPVRHDNIDPKVFPVTSRQHVRPDALEKVLAPPVERTADVTAVQHTCTQSTI